MSDDLLDDLETKPKKRRGVSGFTIAGVLFLVIGLGCFGFLGYQYLGSNVVSAQQTKEEKQDLRSQWDQGNADSAGSKPAEEVVAPAEDPRVPGSAVALMRIPRLGADYEVPVVVGTDAGSLSKGVGWYDHSVRPGQIGNFAVAGHRVTNGEPFRRLLELKKGDEVIIETKDAVYTYVLDNSPADLTVDDKDGWVLDPVPCSPNASCKKDVQPTKELITLTTCQDLFHSADRSVGFGHLVSTKNK